MATFTGRLIGAAKLDVHTYEEVEAKPELLGQALGVVVLASVAAGIAVLGRPEMRGAWGVIAGVIAALVNWFVWAGLTYLIGTRLLPTPQTRADWGQLLRTTGFAASPGILRVLGVFGLTGFVFLVVNVWMIAAFVIAIRQALDYDSTLRAVGVALISWLIAAIVFFLFWLVAR